MDDVWHRRLEESTGAGQARRDGERTGEGDGGAEVWDRWIDLWNGDFTAAADLIGEELHTRLPTAGMPDGATIRDGAALASWIVSFRTTFREARFTTVLGPFAVRDADGGRYLTGRWCCEAKWDGGARPPGVRAEPGAPVRYSGTDVLRLDDEGRIDGYWLSDDLLDVYAQLRVQLPGSQLL
ncbi:MULTISPECIES: hypothetical protein [unclassified Streptomyces]|uniref:hypothetical protein n=1 Tax=unclassified Streptomyces TaxID=2593676 RepID=UPI0038001D8C